MAHAGEPETEGSARKKKKNHVSYLPQELVSSFLLRVPAQALHDVMRHVCREWNLLIRTRDFIYSHLRNSTGGLLVEQTYPDSGIVYVEMRGGNVEISQLDCWGFEDRVLNSCNGLVLVCREDFDIPVVINPLTKQRATLPPYYRPTERWWEFAIAFVDASMEYKVVGSHQMDRFGRKTTEVCVLTLGVDRVWRDIDVEHLTQAKRAAFMDEPYVTGGYMNWVGSDFVITLNLKTETFHEFHLPRSLRRCMNFLPMGSKLSGVDESRKLWRCIWQMNPETGKWTMLHRIDLKPLRAFFYDLFCEDERHLTALGWLVAGEVLVLETEECEPRCVAYNVKTKGILTFELASDALHLRIRSPSHVNSLVWFE